jgi:hypothetical protein
MSGQNRVVAKQRIAMRDMFGPKAQIGEHSGGCHPQSVYSLYVGAKTVYRHHLPVQFQVILQPVIQICLKSLWRNRHFFSNSFQDRIGF